MAVSLVLCCSKNPTTSDGGIGDGKASSVETVVGTEGATLATPGGAASLTVPPGALGQDVKITIDLIEPTPTGTIGQAFEIGPTGLVFKKPVTVTLSYRGANLGGATTSAIKVATQQKGEWQPLGMTVLDLAAQTVSGQTTHLSPYGLRSFNAPIVDGGFLDRGLVFDERVADMIPTVDKVSAPDSGTPYATLAAFSILPEYMVVDATHVYWVDMKTVPPSSITATVWKVPIGGGPAVKVAAENCWPRALAIDASALYLACDYKILKLSKAGGPSVPLVSSPNLTIPESIAVDAKNLYWTENNPSRPSSIPVVGAVPLGGGAVVNLCTSGAPCEVGVARNLAIDATHAYFADGSAIYRVPIGGGAGTVVVQEGSGGFGFRGLAVDQTNLYWTIPMLPKFGGAIRAMPKTGGTPITLAPQCLPQNLVVSGGFVYWISPTDSSCNSTSPVMKVAVTGGTPIELVTGFLNVNRGALAVDGASVYFAISGGVGSIMKVSK